MFWAATLIGANSYMLTLLRRRLHLRSVGIVSSGIDVLLVAGGFAIFWQAMPGPNGAAWHVFYSEGPAWLALLVAINTLSLQPRYPAIVGAAASLALVIAFVAGATSDRAVATMPLEEFSEIRFDITIAANITIMITAIGVASVWSALIARRTVYQAVASEIDLRRLQQEQLETITRAKIDALGKLVAGVSHEMNSPLGALKSSLDTHGGVLDKVAIRLSDADDRRLAKMLDVAQSSRATMAASVDRLQQTLEALRTFSQLDEADFKQVDLRSAIDDVLSMLPTELREVTIEREDDDVPPLYLFARDVNQALLTLLRNACESGASRVTVATRLVDEEVRVTIRDDGRGMTVAQCDALFDVSIRARGERVGAGFGLPTAQNVAHRHGGAITVYSTPGAGSTFVLRLPLTGLTEATTNTP